MEVVVDNQTFVFPRLNFESDSSYALRKEFFVKQPLKTKDDYFKAFNLSMMFANVKILGCTYSDEYMKKLNVQMP